MQKILVIDDAEDIQLLVENALHSLKVSLDRAYTAQEAIQKVKEQSYQLLILDLALPDDHGFELFLKIRSLKGYETVPVVFLTSSDDVSTIVSAFSLGAEDFVAKPFRLLELRARIERRLKTSMKAEGGGEELYAGGLVLNLHSQRVKIDETNEYLSLSPREFKILLLLLKNPDRIFSRKSILESVWGSQVNVTNRTVDAHICYLRKKLHQYSPCIESVSGEGYRFNSKS